MFKVSVPLLTFFVGITGFFSYLSFEKFITKSNEVRPHIPTPEHFMSIDVRSSKRIQDFYEIAIALEKYRVDHNEYPISSNRGLHWDALYDAEYNFNQEWIRGVAPGYIKRLPRDPRKDSNFEHQYTYRSDGANYKLIARYPEDCKELTKKFPDIFDDRIKGCNYGVWTPRAKKWR